MAIVRFRRPEMDSFKREVDRLFNDFVVEKSSVGPDKWNPPVDLSETNDAYLLTAELPGVKKEDIKLTIQENNLILSGEKRRRDELDDYYRTECCYGKFQRSIELPGEIDREKITANFNNGVLQIEIAKKEQSKTRHIKIEQA